MSTVELEKPQPQTRWPDSMGLGAAITDFDGISYGVNVDLLPLELQQAIAEGLADIEAGRVAPHEEVMKQLRERWPKKS